jgi:hypothetical protein
MLVESDQKDYRQQCDGLLRSFRWHAEIVLQANEVNIVWLVYVFLFLCFVFSNERIRKKCE